MVSEKESPMKNRNVKTVALLGILLIALVGGWIGVRALSRQPSPSQDQQEKTEKLSEQKVSQMLTLCVTGGGQTLSLRSYNGLWRVEDKIEFPLDQEYAGALASAFCTTEAIRTMAASDVDLQAAGLVSPRYTVTTAFQNGTQECFYIGTVSQSAGGLYVQKGDRVYLTDASLGRYLGVELASVAEVDTIPRATGIQKITVETGQESVIYTAENEAGRFGVWSGIVLDAAKDYAPSEEAMRAYGLDAESRTTVTVDYVVTTQIEAGSQGGAVQFNQEYTAVLYIGRATEEDSGVTYVQLEGSDLICIMKTQYAQALILQS